MRLGYLVSRYPALSHSFVVGEVNALRARGVAIETFTIRRPPPEEVLSEADREAHGSTYAVLPPRLRDLLGAHASEFARAPARYLATLARALRLGRLDLRGILWQLFYFAEAMVVLSECRRRGVRHLHVHFANVASDVAMIASQQSAGALSWSWTLHGPVELYDVAGHRLAEKVRRAAAVVCISDFARSQLMAHVEPRQWPKLHVMRCGIDTARFSPNGRPRPAAPAPTVLAVGRLSERKGHAVLVEAVGLLARAGVDVRLSLVGDGEQRAELEALARELGVADRVEFAGAVGQDEIRAWYERANVFCLPSFAEGIPVVLMEAMAMELPVVATRIMGIPELVEDGVSGALVAPGRPDELAAALRELIEAPERAAALGAGGRRAVTDRYELDRLAAELEELFAGVLGEREGSAPS